MKFIFLITLSILGFHGHGMTIDCGSYDYRLVYHLDTPDGGTPREPTETLELDGLTMININPAIEANTILINTTFSSQPLWESKPDTSEEFYSSTTAVKHLTATLIEDQSVVFDDYLLCKIKVYVGPPRP